MKAKRHEENAVTIGKKGEKSTVNDKNNINKKHVYNVEMENTYAVHYIHSATHPHRLLLLDPSCDLRSCWYLEHLLALFEHALQRIHIVDRSFYLYLLKGQKAYTDQLVQQRAFVEGLDAFRGVVV